MLRRLTILATTVAILLGSFGLPVSLYSCEMMKAKQAASASCGECSCHMDHAGHAAGQSARKGAAPRSCCAKQHAAERSDVAPAMPPTLQLSTQLAAAIIVLAYHAAGLYAVSPQSEFLIHHPPPLEHQSRDTYLFNSTFLI